MRNTLKIDKSRSRLGSREGFGIPNGFAKSSGRKENKRRMDDLITVNNTSTGLLTTRPRFVRMPTYIHVHIHIHMWKNIFIHTYVHIIIPIRRLNKFFCSKWRWIVMIIKNKVTIIPLRWFSQSVNISMFTHARKREVN